MIIKYVNSNGVEIVLNAGNYLVGAHDLRNFSWMHMDTNRPSGFGGRVTFSRPVQEKTIIVGIKGATAPEFNANASALMALTEPDILNHTPGRLYLGNQYLTCYLATSSAVSVYSRRQNWVSKELKIVVTEPFWHIETTQRFLAGAPETVVGAKRYDGRYDYRYVASTSSGAIINSHYAPCPMRLTIYDAAVNPSITIGGKIYAVDATISAGQRIIVDQLARTIYSLDAAATRINLFDYRDKDNDIFAPIQPGSNTVIYTGDFMFDITIVTQRSEPSWI